MKRILLLILALCLTVPVLAQTTVKDWMTMISERYVVNFVYDPSLPVDARYQGKDLTKGSLEGNLDTLFKGSGIAWERHKRIIVLTASMPAKHTVPAESGQASRQITFQMDTIVAANITGRIDRDINFTQTGLTKIDGAAFRRGFAVLSSPDVLKTLQALPGVASGTEMLSNLYVHGGDGSDNLFLLDGVPLYQICHLGGIFSAFNTDVIENLDFYKSGFPARYGGRTSSVVDIKTKDGDFNEYKGLFSIGLLDGRVQFEGPIVKDKTSFNLALRRSWADAIMYPVCLLRSTEEEKDGTTTAKSNILGYSFTDINAAVTHKFSVSNILSARFYLGNDNLLKTGKTSVASALGKSDTHSELDMSWGNILTSLDWNYILTERWNMHIIGYWSGSRSAIGYFDTFSQESSSSNGVVSPYKWDKSNVMTSHNVLDDIGLTTGFDWRPSSGHHVRLGWSYIHHFYKPDYGYGESYNVSNRVVYDTFFSDTVRAGGHEASLFAEDEIAVTKWLKVNAGLRNTIYAAEGKVWNSLEPRVAMKVQLAPNVNVKASYAEMSQFSHLVATTYLDLPTNCWLPSGERVAPMTSRQIACGIYSKMPHNIHLNVEGWYKTMDNLVEYNGMSSLFVRLDEWQESFKVGRGRSYGLELDGGYETPSLSLNAFYTLSWNERFFEDFWQDWYRDRNDNRHKLTVQANWRINEKIEIYSAWNYHSGNRMTVPTQFLPYIYSGNWYRNENEFRTLPVSRWLYEEPNNLKLPDYHRLDIGMNIHGKTRRGRDSVLNISIYNAYCRINTLYATFSRKDSKGEDRRLILEGTGHGLIPVIPSISYTLNF